MNHQWHYDWQAGLAFLLILIVTTKILKWLAFKSPELQQALAENKAEDRIKRAKDKYPPVMRASRNAGLGANLVFVLAIAPFFVTLSPQPWWQVILDIVVILMVYDFFYYLTHRFLFHGQGYFRRVHAVHHQARNPTHIDAYYVHPLETFVGVFLFLSTIVALGLFMGPFHSITVALTFVIFTQLNIINHCHVDIPHSPYKTLSWITAKHAVHHENMHKGNYATITLLYDKLFGTLD